MWRAVFQTPVYYNSHEYIFFWKWKNQDSSREREGEIGREIGKVTGMVADAPNIDSREKVWSV